MGIFSRKKQRQDLSTRSQVELVSIHIPKTAGTSFRNILKQMYGEQQVIRIDITLPSEKTPFSSVQPSTERLPDEVRIIHGHFRFPDIAALYHLDPDVPVITWLRDPVERVISNYFYLQKILREIIQEEQRRVNILSKMEKTLLEYASADINRNRTSKFLEGLRLQDLFLSEFRNIFQKISLIWPRC